MNLTILLQAAAPQSGFEQYSSILMFALIFVVFYLFMIRPQQKKQKEVQAARDAIKSGDRVLTSGGIYGKVREVNADAFVVEVADGVRIRVEKNSVFALSEEKKEK